MPTPSIDISMFTQSPLLQGRERAVIERFLEEAKQEVIHQALANVQMYLDTNIRNPTPYYETQIILERMQEDMVVHDRGIIYGPWLEGTAPANARSSFKGYHSFRKARQETEGQVGRLVLAVLRRYLGRL